MKTSRNKWMCLIVSLCFGFGWMASSWGASFWTLPVQDAGRIKPLDTFARESLQLIYGRRSYEGKSALDIVLTWLLVPDHWQSVQFVEVKHSGLREALNLQSQRLYYSPAELLGNDRLPLLAQELRTVRERQEKLNPYFQALQRLENQLGMFRMIQSGDALRVGPVKGDGAWQTLNELDEEARKLFLAATKAYVDAIARGDKNPIDDPAVMATVDEFHKLMLSRSDGPHAYDQKMKVEVHYNRFHPFLWAWILYLLGALFFIIGLFSQKSVFSNLGWVLTLAGFGLHTYGMGLRSYIAGRPPVSNMYETVVWVPWGTMFFGYLLERWLKNRVVLICSAVVAVFCLILTDLSPTVLDASLHPLEPVLRSSFWLTTHVLIITISYAAFFLAFALGDLVLFYCLRDEERYKKQIQDAVMAIYRSIQIGVVLLAAGIILGGIWADYSWGRFWGWDPKETWALIALLGYLALLHARLVGLVKGFGMAAGSVVAFSLVIMAWYGVNFVLGAGLHSYGFGAGGVEYVSGFVAAHILFVTYVATVRYSRKNSEKTIN